MTFSVQRRRVLTATASACALAWMPSAMAQLRIEISGVGSNQIPVALEPFEGTAATGINLMQVVHADLSRSGEFRVIDVTDEAQPEGIKAPNWDHWREQQAMILATGSIQALGDGRYSVTLYVYDIAQTRAIDAWSAVCTERQLRMTAHRMADRIYTKVTGFGPMFTSRLAYVVQHSRNSYELLVADSDGANALPALRSREPIISPAWSPDGKQLAYVSFENGKPIVYVHTLATGKRQVVSNFRGNNSAPAFTPDGKQLAVALSREGNTQIFLVSTDGLDVRRFTQSLAIDTEPFVSADGMYVYYTSDRGGRPQIYRQPLNGSPMAQRLTFASPYSVSPAVNPQGTHLVYVARTNGNYRVHIMDLNTGVEQALTTNQLDENPCFSPNGRLVLYATERHGRGILGTVSMDGRVSSLLTAATGDIREPTWGPVL